MLSKSQVKYIQSLGQKRQRDLDGVFIAEGPKIVAELLAMPNVSVAMLFALQDWTASSTDKVVPVLITEDELAKISQLQTPNQVLAVIKQFPESTLPVADGQLVLALDGIQDPGNMGTIIRIADWFGIRQIVCNHGCADIYNSKVVQSTMGSIGRVQVNYVILPEWLGAQRGKAIYAAALDGVDIRTLRKLNEGVIVIGNESKGISLEVLEHINERITISRVGEAESLNAAVATGIILSHLVE